MSAEVVKAVLPGRDATFHLACKLLVNAKSNKVEDRVVAVADYHVYIITPSLKGPPKIEASIHFLDLGEVHAGSARDQLSVTTGSTTHVFKEFPKASGFVSAVCGPLRDLFPVEPLGRFFATNVPIKLPSLQNPAVEACDNFVATYHFACRWVACQRFSVLQSRPRLPPHSPVTFPAHLKPPLWRPALTAHTPRTGTTASNRAPKG